jgi:uncharacterized protein YuzE
MKLTIDKEADALYLDLDETPAVESEEISPGVILDYNSEGKVTGIEPEAKPNRNVVEIAPRQLVRSNSYNCG